MIRIQQLKISIKHSKEELLQKAAKTLKINLNQIKDYNIVKRSIDARKKTQVSYVYVLDVTLVAGLNEQKIIKKVNSNNVMVTKIANYQFPVKGQEKLTHSPVVVGSGPAGLFCAYGLARMGYCPIVIERG